MMLPLPIRQFENEEEHFPIDFYFDDCADYEVAVVQVNMLKRPNKILTIYTNILDVDVFNKDQILCRVSPFTGIQVTDSMYYKIDVGSLQNFRIKIPGIVQQQVAITLHFRKI